jgi:hypothetical protein
MESQANAQAGKIGQSVAKRETSVWAIALCFLKERLRNATRVAEELRLVPNAVERSGVGIAGEITNDGSPKCNWSLAYTVYDQTSPTT